MLIFVPLCPPPSILWLNVLRWCEPFNSTVWNLLPTGINNGSNLIHFARIWRVTSQRIAIPKASLRDQTLSTSTLIVWYMWGFRCTGTTEPSIIDVTKQEAQPANHLWFKLDSSKPIITPSIILREKLISRLYYGLSVFSYCCACSLYWYFCVRG